MSRYEDRLNDYNRRRNADRLQFNTLQELVDICGQLHNQWLHTNVDQWNQDPLHTPVHYFNEDWLYDQQDANQATELPNGDIIPNDLLEEHLKTWFELATFEDVIDVLHQAQQPVTLPMIIIALKYYHEYDAFLDYDQVEAQLRLHNTLQQVANNQNNPE